MIFREIEGLCRKVGLGTQLLTQPADDAHDRSMSEIAIFRQQFKEQDLYGQGRSFFLQERLDLTLKVVFVNHAGVRVGDFTFSVD